MDVRIWYFFTSRDYLPVGDVGAGVGSFTSTYFLYCDWCRGHYWCSYQVSTLNGWNHNSPDYGVVFSRVWCAYGGSRKSNCYFHYSNHSFIYWWHCRLYRMVGRQKSSIRVYRVYRLVAGKKTTMGVNILAYLTIGFIL